VDRTPGDIRYIGWFAAAPTNIGKWEDRGRFRREKLRDVLRVHESAEIAEGTSPCPRTQSAPHIVCLKDGGPEIGGAMQWHLSWTEVNATFG
jgi:hypothetical protein